LDSARFWIETYQKLEDQGRLDIETIGELRKWLTLYATQYQHKVGKPELKQDVVECKQ